MIGKRLGPYEILAPLGKGGMGEIFRARDPRLGREVAVKVLPEEVAASPDRLRRFEQEARAASGLNHPNILTVHDVGVESGRSYLVTELLEGESLRELLRGAPLPVERTIDIASQIARGLAAAHERGIVHRDLKPDNLFLTRRGIVKILDFGLAKLAPFGEGGKAATTIDGGETAAGAVLGTVGYMAPEQVRGERVDPRADIFSLGCVIYELLVGRRAFLGGSAIETLNAILKEDPLELAPQRAGLPATLVSVLDRCLAKNPDERFQSARDLGFALELARREGARSAAAPTLATRQQRGWGALVAAAGAGALIVGLAALWLPKRSTPARSLVPPTVGALSPLTVDPGYEGQPSLSPDGETVAYVADRSGNFEIYLEQVGGGTAINLTQNPADDVQPAISPDGRQVAFVSTRESRLALTYRTARAPLMGGDIWILPALGGLARRIVEEGNFPEWSPDGRTIYFVRNIWFRAEIRRVAATGGESSVVPVELPDGIRPPSLLDPKVSPDGRWLLFSSSDTIFLLPIDGGKATVLAAGRNATWDPSGAAIFYCSTEPGRNSNLWWLPFSSERGAASAPAQALLVGPASLEGSALSRSGRRLVVTAVDRTGNLETLPLDAEAGTSGTTPRPLTRGRHDISFASASPDARSIVYQDLRGSTSHLWRRDDGHEPVRLTDDPAFEESYPRWSPDARSIAFTRHAANSARLPTASELWIMAADGGAPRLLTKDGGNMAWLPDARRLLFIHGKEFHLLDLATGSERPLAIEGPSALPVFTISPDSEWLVYPTTESGDVDLVLVPLTGGRSRLLVRTERQDGHPLFTRSGRWLYFQPDHRNLWRIPGPAQGWRKAAPQQVTHLPESGLFLEEPQLAGDGRQLFYSRIQTAADLWVVELESPSGSSPPVAVHQ